MVNVIRWLVEACNPCIHQWTTTATLKDREENPTAVRMVQECAICGDVRQQDFVTPETTGTCRHKWRTTTVHAVYTDDPKTRTEKTLPGYHRHTQVCEHCGDVRKVDLK